VVSGCQWQPPGMLERRQTNEACMGGLCTRMGEQGSLTIQCGPSVQARPKCWRGPVSSDTHTPRALGAVVQTRGGGARRDAQERTRTREPTGGARGAWHWGCTPMPGLWDPAWEGPAGHATASSLRCPEQWEAPAAAVNVHHPKAQTAISIAIFLCGS